MFCRIRQKVFMYGLRKKHFSERYWVNVTRLQVELTLNKKTNNFPLNGKYLGNIDGNKSTFEQFIKNKSYF